MHSTKMSFSRKGLSVLCLVWCCLGLEESAWSANEHSDSVTASAKDLATVNWKRRIDGAIQEKFDRLFAGRFKEGKATVTYQVTLDGKLLNAELVQPSTDSLFNKSALNCVRNFKDPLLLRPPAGVVYTSRFQTTTIRAAGSYSSKLLDDYAH